eukprot:1065670-Prorocentrum_minimum.AAC.1
MQKELHESDKAIIKGLSSSLKQEVVMAVYAGIIEKVPFFEPPPLPEPPATRGAHLSSRGSPRSSRTRRTVGRTLRATPPSSGRGVPPGGHR